MYKSPNEIALEEKVKQLETKITQLEKFENNMCTQFTILTMSTIAGEKGQQLALEAFDKMKDLVADRAEHYKKQKAKYI